MTVAGLSSLDVGKGVEEPWVRVKRGNSVVSLCSHKQAKINSP